jgi:hypothetical protein
MKVAVLSTVIFEVPDGSTLYDIRERFLRAHQIAVDQPMETLTGQPYVLRGIERLEVEKRPKGVT